MTSLNRLGQRKIDMIRNSYYTNTKEKQGKQTSNQTKNLGKYKNGSTTHQGWGRGNGRGVRGTFPTKGKVSIEMDSKKILWKPKENKAYECLAKKQKTSPYSIVKIHSFDYIHHTHWKNHQTQALKSNCYYNITPWCDFGFSLPMGLYISSSDIKVLGNSLVLLLLLLLFSKMPLTKMCIMQRHSQV
jgi:hypothetical protein